MIEILNKYEQKETKKISEQDKKQEFLRLRKTKQKVAQIRILEIKQKLKELEENKQIEKELGIFNEERYLQEKKKLEEFLSKAENNEKIDFQEFKELSERISKLNKKLNKLLLIDKVMNMYSMYLQHIYENIQAKWLSEKDERYKKQINIIEKELMRLKYFKIRIDENIDKYLDKMLVSERKLGTILSLPFMYIAGPRGTEIHNPKLFEQRANKNYEKILEIIRNYNGTTKEDLKQTEYRIYKFMRENDFYDEMPNLRDSGTGIDRNIFPYVLELKEIKENKKIQLITKLAIKLQNDIRNLSKLEDKEDFLKFAYGKYPEIKNIISEDILEKIFEKIRTIQKNKKEIKNNIKKDLKHKLILRLQLLIEENKLIPKEEIKEYFEDYENGKLTKKGEKLFKEIFNPEKIDQEIDKLLIEIEKEIVFKEFINYGIEQNIDVKKANGILKMYANINGLGDYISDENWNNTINKTEEIVEMTFMLYISGIISGRISEIIFSRLESKIVGLEYIKLAEEISPSKTILGKIEKRLDLFKLNKYELAKVLGIDGLLLSMEGGIFGALLQGEKNIKQAEKIEDLKQIDMENIGRIILFLGVLKAISVDIPVEKLRSKILKEGIELTLDTGFLIGTDTIVKLMLNEGLPENRDDIVKYLYKEMEEIIPILIGLKAINKGKNKVEVVIMGNDRVKINGKEYSKDELVGVLNKPKQKIENKEEKGQEKESVDYTVDTSLYKLASIKLEKVLKGFKKGDKLDERFEKILTGNKDTEGILKDGEEVIKEIVFEKVRELKQDKELTMEDIKFVEKILKRLNKEYEKALYETIKVMLGKQKELSKEYGNPEIVKKLMMEIIEKGMNKEGLKELIEKVKLEVF